ncbi:MAG: hypothetical protein E4H38_06830 [Gemmatimonadales bacterium]|jgi:hypothetical protein|nr:MAG: hypothetical protein E4H38_06830 [Gemmatimonadales bacterium]
MLQRRNLLGAATLAALLLSLTACGGGEKPSAAKRPEAAGGSDQAQNEATQLGAEITNVLDRVMAYAVARSGRAPATIAEVGLDSLTPKIVRRVSRQGRDILISVAFRRPAGRAVSECHGTNRVLEELSLMGHYELTCTVAGGGTRTFTIEPGAATAK